MTPDEIVTAFLKMHGDSKAALHESFDLYFSDDTIWENVGLSKTKGIAEAKHVLETAEKMGIETISIETLHQASHANLVFNERLDHLKDKGGKEVFALRVMGIFEVEHGKIVKWRDYCDTASLPPMN
jgi:limonene-1,2-epoxide hydrolase